MKSASEIKKPPSSPPCSHLDGELEIGEPIFFAHMAKTAGLTRKDFQYELRVSKTLVDSWFSGDKLNPLERARGVVALFLRRKRADLIPAILVYIAGGEFDGTVLTEEQTEALRQLAKALVK